MAKAPLSASGQHRIRLDHAATDAWLSKHLKTGPVICEPWYDKIIDVSLQLDIDEKGSRSLGISRFWTTLNGTYRGAVLGPWSSGVEPSVLRSLHGGGRGSQINELLTQVSDDVGTRLHERGIRGAVGVDCMVIREDQEIRVLPILEINPRLTMGRIALELHRSTGLRGAWFFIDDAMLKRAGFEERESFIEAVQQSPNMVFTTDPSSALKTLTVMVGAKKFSGARQAWMSLGLMWPD